MTDVPTWSLDYYDGDSRRWVRVPITHVPFRLGRKPGLDLTLASSEISSEHAEIAADGARLLLRDLGSRNGTFLRDQPVVGAVPIQLGDVFRLASLAFRLGHSAEPMPQEPPRAARTPEPLSTDSFSRQGQALDSLLESQAVEPLFQPIVDLNTGATVALEALGRGRSPDLPQSPVELFKIAEAQGDALELARCFRQTALSAAHWARTRLPIFLNVHASELEAHGFFDEIAATRARHPKIPLVLQISEQHSTPLGRLRLLRTFLTQQKIGLAYDDFGAGLARIQELAEVPADFLMFDSVLVRDLDRVATTEQRRVAALVAAAKALGMRLLAEGIETPDEARACRKLGFELGQGFQFGRPESLTAKG